MIDTPGATRGLRVRFARGDTVSLTLLVPALNPEQSLADRNLPTLTMRRPDGSTAVLNANVRVRFDEPFSGTGYLRLIELSEPAQAGKYGLIVTAGAPSRFTVSVHRLGKAALSGSPRRSRTSPTQAAG